MLNSKEKKLRKLLEELSTSEELEQDKLEEISQKIDDNKVKIDWNIVSSLIEQAKESIGEKIDDFKEEFNSKKYPTYDDTKLKELLEKIDEEIKEDPLLKEAEQKGKQAMINELIFIGNTLVDIKKASENNENKESDKKLDKINENLEGVGQYLLKILSKTGSNNSFQIKDSSNTIINPATEETLQSIAGFSIPKYDEIVITYVPSGNGVGEIQTVVYKLLTVTQGTLTLTYDSNNKLSGVSKS